MFCSNCGKEVSNNAYVCTGCGCLVGGKKVTEARDKSASLRMLILISVVSIVLEFLLFTLSYATYSGGRLIFDESVVVPSYLLSWLFVFPMGVVVFIFGFKEKRSAALRLIANITFIICIAIFITTVIVFSCQR